MSNKEIYCNYCKENDVPLFNQPFWWETVASEQWDVAIVERGGNLVAALPYHIKTKGVHKIILPPQLTQYTTLILNYPEGQKYASKIGFEKEQISQIIEQLPQVDYIELTLSPTLTNWLPFKWNEFSETTRYTYLIEDLSDLDVVFKGCKENIRREIKKGEKQLSVEVMEDVDLFYEVNQKTFERQKIKNPYSKGLFEKVDISCSNHKCRSIYVAKDIHGNIHGSIYIVWDKETSYYLAGGSDPEFRTSGAHSLLMWKAIQDASKRKQKFDFKGSMIESVERFFRGFGAVQTPYFKVKKYNSKALKLILPLLYKE